MIERETGYAAVMGPVRHTETTEAVPTLGMALEELEKQAKGCGERLARVLEVLDVKHPGIEGQALNKTTPPTDLCEVLTRRVMDLRNDLYQQQGMIDLIAHVVGKLR